jgi:hypothetical protein
MTSDREALAIQFMLLISHELPLTSWRMVADFVLEHYEPKGKSCDLIDSCVYAKDKREGK